MDKKDLKTFYLLYRKRFWKATHHPANPAAKRSSLILLCPIFFDLVSNRQADQILHAVICVRLRVSAVMPYLGL